LMPEKLAADAESIARSFIDSLVLGTGQFCTNPGLVLGIEGEALERFRQAAAAALSDKPSTPMLTSGIHAAYASGVRQLAMLGGVSTVALGKAASTENGFAARPALFATQAATLFATTGIEREVFGPAGVVVACRDIEELRLVAEHLEGQLTATLYLAAGDHANAKRLLPVLERKVGRVLFNGFPTGVEVAHAMVHGGPFPATSDSRTTSVGTLAIERFLRPVCYQDMPPELLAPALVDDNPLRLWRLVDGQRVRN
ncbi:MAG: aldehyde dehydrogenase family protein, partial [Rhodopseudomonas sp.]|uniref:aldehyde dehydrogenase family protein n=1 Tax=Rhodopseudomonas sp. TaxID=1078 RepID=UPI00182B9F6E